MPKPLRVLQVVGKMDLAGAETLLMNLYRRINRNRIQFDFLVHRQEAGYYDAEILSLGGRMHHLCPMTASNLFLYWRKVTAFFWEHPEYRIVHSHIDAMSTLPLAGAKRSGVPVRIAHSHNTAFPKDVKYPIRLLAKSLLPMQTTDYFSCTPEAALFLFPDKIVQSKNCIVLPDAIELDKFAFSPSIRMKKRKELELHDETFVVGHVGRFCTQKNHLQLIRIFAAIHQACPDSILLLVGQGELQKKVFTFCMQLGIQNSVRFLGARDDVAQLMQAFDIFIFPSLYEGFGIAGAEAQAAGLPCLFSDNIQTVAPQAGLVTFLPLEADDTAWAEKALELRRIPRRDRTVQLAAQGLDVREQAAFMENFYLNIGRT